MTDSHHAVNGIITWNLPGIITGSKSTGDEASKDNDHMMTMVKLHGLFSHKLWGWSLPT